MKSRQLMYALTFLTYALIHSFRTGWSYIKPFMQHQPFLFTSQFLGEIDLTVLISLAISLKTIGWVGQKIGFKSFLLIGMGYLVLLSITISIVLIKGVTHHWVYIFLLCMVGISMCTAWPSCLSIVSKYYSPVENSFLICVWNGCSQFGDLIAISFGYIIIQSGGAPQGYLILAISLLLLVMLVVNWFFLVPEPQAEPVGQSQHQTNRDRQSSREVQKNKSNEEKQSQKIQVKELDKSSQLYNSRLSQPEETGQVNFLNVWCLPSVLTFTCCFACLKAINAIIMNWLFMYLFSIGINRLSGIITLGWSISIFVGNLLMGYYNKSTNKIGMMVPLVFAGFVFGYLGVEYQHSGSVNYAVLLVLAGLCFGGPFGLIGSKVALLLAEHPETKPKKNALAAIISVMWGFGQFVSAFFVLIVPYLGLRRLFYLPAILCMISSAILLYEHKKGVSFSKRQSLKKREQELRNFN